MSRRNQARRRRNYGRRQHELHERRPQATDVRWDERAALDEPRPQYPRWSSGEAEELRP